MLKTGFHDVPRGCVAAVITYLEMRAPPAPRAVADLPDLPDLIFRQVASPDPDWYRDLYTRVGALDWLWFSRLQMSPDALATILHDPQITVCSLRRGDRDLALLELDFRQPGACELAFFGVAPELIGTGAGRVLMTQAIALAWAQPITRFHVHTCTLDHPAALPFYMRSGFTPIRRQIEIAPDPRLDGTLPGDSAPQIPVL